MSLRPQTATRVHGATRRCGQDAVAIASAGPRCWLWPLSRVGAFHGGFHAPRITTSCLVVVVCLVMLGGCGEAVRRPETARGSAPRDGATASRVATEGMRQQLLSGMVAILSALDRYDAARGSEQVFDRLIQWRHAAGTSDSPPLDSPLLESLPELLLVGTKPLIERDAFDATGDVVAIRDRCWLAAIARTARGDAEDDLTVALNLFRWTVRSLAPVSDPPMVPSDALPGSRWFLPGEILLAGRASGPQRAWIFLELLRQAGLDGVMLATTSGDAAPPRPWLPAVIIGGEAYLFEPTYGMPIAGPGGAGVATARQAAEDPAILAALSTPARRYPVQADAIAKGVAILVAADPWSLAPRMAALDRELFAADGIRVAVNATRVAEQAAAVVPRAREGATVTQALWTFPWETVARRSLAAGSLAEELGPLEVPVPDPTGGRGGFRALFAGRVREFRGDFDGPAGAKAAYLAARVSRRAMNAALVGVPENQATAVADRLIRMKEDATYWLGLLMLAEGQDAAAVYYLQRMTLEAAPDSRWTDAARINLATALARLGQTDEAVALLREEGSPQRYGSRLLAARLEAAAAAEKASESDPGTAADEERVSE